MNTLSPSCRILAASALALAASDALAQAEFAPEVPLRLQLALHAPRIWTSTLPAGTLVDHNQTIVLDDISPVSGALELVKPWRTTDNRAPRTTPVSLGATVVANCGSAAASRTLMLRGKALQTVKVNKRSVLPRRMTAAFTGAQVFPGSHWPQAMRIDFNSAQADMGSELRPLERSQGVEVPARQVRAVELVGHRLTGSTAYDDFSPRLRPAAATPVNLAMRALGMACANIKYFSNTTLYPVARQCIHSGESVNFDIGNPAREMLTLLEVTGRAVVDVYRDRDGGGNADTFQRTTEFNNLDNGYRSMRVRDVPQVIRSVTWGQLASWLGAPATEFSMPLGSLEVDMVASTQTAGYHGDAALLANLCGSAATGLVERVLSPEAFAAARAAGQLQASVTGLP